MAEQTEVEWPTCEQAGCIGIRLGQARMCLAHGSEADTAAGLRVVEETGEIDARGVPITSALLGRILAAAPRDDEEPLIKSCQFDRATFSDDAQFSGTTFNGDAQFSGATFNGDARFDGATFRGGAQFGGVRFGGNARFGGATFSGDAVFSRATFPGYAQFDGATFSGYARFDSVTFGGAQFTRAIFSGFTLFDNATFSGGVVFSRATFSGVQFTKAIFSGMVWFSLTAFSGSARFDEATFNLYAQFDGATFGRYTNFREVTFDGGADFSDARFDGEAVFAKVLFSFDAQFSRATFSAITWFSVAAFSGDAWFRRAAFDDRAQFDGATFSRDARFDEATFSGNADFDEATFSRDAYFDEASLNGEAGFSGTTFKRRAGFAGAKFEQARQFGPLLAYRGLLLDEAQFAQQVQIEVSSTGVCCRRARFAGGVQFRLRWARVVLDDTDLAAPSILAGIPRLSSQALARREERIARAWQRLLPGEIGERPQLMSLRRTDVAGLKLSNVSAANCRFAGAHNLDALRLESDVSFVIAPMPVTPGGRGWGGREVIAEECAWRANRSRRHWVVPKWPHWLEDEEPGVLDSGQIAGLYRALRKGREDIKDEPGAADFYYGEMEMRRARPNSDGNRDGHSGEATRGRVERGILTAYWLVSGYGLRAWRAIAALAVVTAVLAVAFHLFGFAVPPRPVSYLTSLLYAFRATLSLTDDEVTLTAWGQLLQAVLKLTGPVLLGLALLALRGRVKR
jgi:uncharacterized protein YjbI with pentapeptide repeats